MVKQAKKIPDAVVQQLKLIGEKVSELQRSPELRSQLSAEPMNVTRMTIWRIEKGKDFQFSTLLLLLNAYGIPIEDFFKGVK